MADSYVPIFHDWPEITKELNATEKGRLIDAIVEYSRGGDWQSQIQGNERFLFPAFQRQIDRQREISEVRAFAGARGGKAKQTKPSESNAKQNEAKGGKSAKEEEYKEEYKEDKEYNISPSNEGESKTKRFMPPTRDEVKAYCQERNAGVDADKWYDYYTANGWKVGRNPMKDWKATVRTWEKNEFAKPKAKNIRASMNYGEADKADMEHMLRMFNHKEAGA